MKRLISVLCLIASLALPAFLWQRNALAHFISPKEIASPLTADPFNEGEREGQVPTILRVTGPEDGSQAFVSYTSGSNFNLDSTRFFLNRDGITVFYQFDPRRLEFNEQGPIFGEALRLESPQWSAVHSDTIIGLDNAGRGVKLYAYDAQSQTSRLLKDFTTVLAGGVTSNLSKSRANDDRFAFSWKEEESSPWHYVIIWNRVSDQVYLFDVTDPVSGTDGFNEARFDKSGEYITVIGKKTRLWRLSKDAQSSSVEIPSVDASTLQLKPSPIWLVDSSLPVRASASLGQSTVRATDQDFYLRFQNDIADQWVRIPRDGSTNPEPYLAAQSASPVAGMGVRANVSPNGRFLIFNTQSGGVSIAALPDVGASPVNVEWVDLVNCNADASTLRKVEGEYGADDASAASAQVISYGDGYIEFTAAESDTQRWCGLTPAVVEHKAAADLAFAIKLTGNGMALAVENGFNKKKIRYQRGDSLRVGIESNRIRYYKNGAVFYTSRRAPSYPLTAQAYLFDRSSTIGNAVIAGSSKTVQVAIDPERVILNPGSTQNFIATIKGAKNHKVTWAAEGGTISASGLYTAPSEAGTYTVTATSVAKPKFSAKAAIYVGSADTTPPIISNVSCSDIASGTATITWQTSEPSDAQIEFGKSETYESLSAVNVALRTEHSIMLTGLSTGGELHYRVKSRDFSGNLAVSGDYVINAIPIKVLLVTITSPTLNQTVAGVITVSANASSVYGIAGVQFKLDDNNIGAEDTMSPYSVSVDTTLITNGIHILTAEARDKLGRRTRSVAVPIKLRQFFVSVAGSSAANGSKNSPWNLRTALNHPPVVQAGDTIWLRGGTYRGSFTSLLTGTASAPIVVRQFPGERAIIDNNWTTTLTSSITAAQTTFAVADISGLQSGISVQIDGEDINLYGAISGNIIRQAVRGWNGTTPTVHSAGAIVKPISNTLTLKGAYTWYWGFEVTNSEPNRILPSPRRRVTGVDVFAPYCKLINLVIHDNGLAVGFWAQAVGAEAYGNIIFNNGFETSPGNGTGHGIYTQNQDGNKRIADNILFGQMSRYGIHAYGSEAAYLSGFIFEGNVSINDQWLVGGASSASRINITNNYLYGTGFTLGYTNARNEDATVTNNFVYATLPLQANWWRTLTITDNKFISRASPSSGSVNLYLRQDSGIANHVFDRNTYYNGRMNFDRNFTVHYPDGAVRPYFFSGWQQLGYDTHSTYINNPNPNTPARPTGTNIFVRPNTYEPGRAHIIIYNWLPSSTVRIDLAQSGLQPGDQYEIRDAQNYLASPLVTGVYDGTPVNISLNGLVAARPIGNSTIIPSHTSSEFSILVVVRKNN